MSSYYASGVYQTDGTVIEADDIYSKSEVDSLLAGLSGLAEEDIDTLAEINAILTDANLASVAYVDELASNYATAAQGTTADSALQPSDITSGAITAGTGDIDFDDLGGGVFTNPGGYTQSEVFGATAFVSANRTTAFGSGANCQAFSSTAFGYAASPRASNATAIGSQAYVSTDGANGIAIGTQAWATASGAFAMGTQSDATGSDAICIGTTSQATANHAIAIGASADSSHLAAICIGRNADSTKANQLVFGSTGSRIEEVYFPGSSQVAWPDNHEFGGSIKFPPYTFATLPSASASTGAVVRITDRGQKQAYSDGTNWLFTHDNAVAS